MVTTGFVMGELVMGRWHWCASTFDADAAACREKAQRGGLTRGTVCHCTITTLEGHPDCVLYGRVGHWKGHINLIPLGEENSVPWHRKEASGPPREVRVEAPRKKPTWLIPSPPPPARRKKAKRRVGAENPPPKAQWETKPCLRCGRETQLGNLGCPECLGRKCFECGQRLRLEDEFVCWPCKLEQKLKMDRRVKAGESLAPRQAAKMV